MSVVEFIFRKAGEVFNFAKDRLHFVVSLGTLKILRTDISLVPTMSYNIFETNSSFHVK